MTGEIPAFAFECVDTDVLGSCDEVGGVQCELIGDVVGESGMRRGCNVEVTGADGAGGEACFENWHGSARFFTGGCIAGALAGSTRLFRQNVLGRLRGSNGTQLSGAAHGEDLSGVTHGAYRRNRTEQLDDALAVECSGICSGHGTPGCVGNRGGLHELYFGR